ncbi:DUF2513 domain-containing protein [Comamonas jiangduensis]|uniref:DUF2513 domain-containing protein n=1 Tax=Comamonas jiangduensis TaxID=1194168 RepID=UPI0024E0C0FC|nr:DUF2513 domain-containing protein [Comamonas jiangduensis]
MKRDMDLMRDILLWLEDNHSGVPVFQDRDKLEIGYHCHLLADAGLIEAANSSHMEDPVPQAHPLSITSKGHDFIDASRSKTIWSSVKNKVISSTGGVSIAILTELLKDEAKRRLGLSAT